MRPPISQEQETLLRELRTELRQHHRGGRLLVAVDGRDGAGEDPCSPDALADVLREDGSSVFRASADDFHRPRAERYARGRASAEGHYRDSYDNDALLERLLRPFRAGAGFVTAVHDLEEDRAVEVAADVAPADAVLVVDGLFLLRPELRDVWNWSVWLDVPLDRRIRSHGRTRRQRPRPSRRLERTLPRRLRALSPGRRPSRPRERHRRQHRPDASRPRLPGLLLMAGEVAPTGVLLADKPGGLTSHDVVSRTRRALNTRKVGHAGTLDPMATGLLVSASAARPGC